MRRFASILRAVDERPLAVTAAVTILVKLASLAVDRTPLFFLGDSHAYLAAALDHWVPMDRSFLYPLVIRVVAVWTHSLAPLLVLQALAGAATAVLVAALLCGPLGVRPRVAVLSALLLSVEPGQFLYERMIMTEAFSLTALALLLLLGARYVERPRLATLAATAVVGILLVALRTVYIPISFASAAALPALALARIPTWRTRAIHLAVAVVATLACHTAYKAWIGYESDLPAAYQYNDGFFVACSWAPVLEPEDADDPRAAAAISRMVAGRAELPWGEFSRDLLRWQPGWFVDDLVATYGGDVLAANAAAKRAAMHALRRDPAGVARLGWVLYRDYWTVGTDRLAVALASEHGDDRALGPLVPILAEHFGVPDAAPIPGTLTLAKRYHTAGRSLLLVYLVTPALLAAAIFAARRERWLAGLFVFVVFSSLLGVTCLFGSSPVYRYLHPFAVALVVAVALIADRSVRAGSGSDRVVPDR